MRKLQVFATDLNEALLDKARHGLYAKSIAQDLSPERLRRFFVEEEGGYRIGKRCARWSSSPGRTSSAIRRSRAST